MPKKKTITFAVSAFDDLENIRVWYTDQQQVPDVGERLIKEIISQIERLSEFPESGRIVPEFNIGNLREIIFSPFRSVYRLDDNKIKIIRIWRSERLLKISG
ncbi:death on curing protein, doc toxin [hydrocarbon metagenome]|uniref:Death on curing protein, doc toxin n=1 Tax=hydrocarbon metagenome TaxID=938273 RepID=A0A0W8FTE0_9ZZZZ